VLFGASDGRTAVETINSHAPNALPSSALSGTALLRQLRHRAGQSWDRHCTPHGWRSCFRDWCGDIGDVPRDLAEAALAHSLNATEGAYRRMTAGERRREVMTRYADWLNDARGKVLAFYSQERLSCSSITFSSTDKE
jgi:integrase